MNKDMKMKRLLSQYLSRKYDVIKMYFNGLPAGPVVAEKMERLTGLPAKWFRRPNDYGVFPFHFCLLNYDEILLKLNELGYWEDL